MVLKRLKKKIEESSKITKTYLTKGKAAAVKQKKQFRKDDLKVKSEFGGSAKDRAEAKARLIHGDEAINKLKKKTKKSQKDRDRMNKLKKEKPKAYQRIKKRRREKEWKSKQRKTKSGKYVSKINSHEWD